MQLAQIQNLKISYVCTEHGVAFMWYIGKNTKQKKASWMSGYVSHRWVVNTQYAQSNWSWKDIKRNTST